MIASITDHVAGNNIRKEVCHLIFAWCRNLVLHHVNARLVQLRVLMCLSKRIQKVAGNIQLHVLSTLNSISWAFLMCRSPQAGKELDESLVL